MKPIYILLACFLLPGVVKAQTSSANPDSSANDTNLATEVKALREALLQTQKQMAAQQREIETLKAQSKNAVTVAAPNELPDRGNGAAGDSGASTLEPASVSAGTNIQQKPPSPQVQEKTKPEDLPLGSFRVGDAVMEVGGFVDLENIYRTTNTQGNISTPFQNIPFNDTAQGRVSELRTTAQFSRFSFKVTDKFAGNDVLGYLETDFSGNDAAGVYQTINPHTERLRLYFMDLKHNKWEILGGQTWSWLTPNREGIGPMPVDLAITYNEAPDIGVGVPYTRAAEFRVAYHPNEHWAMGVGIEGSNQFTGGFVALPAEFTSVSSQFDNNAQIGAPNFFPDILSKITHDRNLAGRHFHAEVVGLFTGAHATVIPLGSASFKTRSTVGGGGAIAANYELIPNKLVILANAFWSDGGAHYLVGTGPQLVVRPNAAGTDVSLSMVHAGAGSAGLEWRASPKQAFAIYYGANYFGQNFFPDTTNTAHPGTIIGYGGPGSPSNNNRAIQQVTFDWLQTLWKDRRYGALQTYVQYSYLTRDPWSVAPGDPKNAHLSMVYAGFRYVLPSSAGTLLRVPYPN
ncbi:MAG TPA: hypothetical protein VNO32_39175 [Candidatus Acidoferrum sp.]|nr:hypothetical protein [Candidatus Acidoferrum sp.]